MMPVTVAGVSGPRRRVDWQLSSIALRSGRQDFCNKERAMPACPFCDGDLNAQIANGLAFACLDKYPVNQGHLLILPRRHVATWFEATADEKVALLALLDEGKRLLDERFAPDGYNIGINVGEAAGQTVMHLHLHLIPRYRGDCANPRGGVRGVIPSRQSYPQEGSGHGR
jgi:diadenosine tetraphosphate (Ap4A) HIT family hydrolase